MTTVTIGGAEHAIAPLKTLQVAEFFDSIKPIETKTEIFTRSIHVIAMAMVNAKNPLVSGLSDAEALAKLNETASFEEVNTAFTKVLEVTGLAKPKEPGEAPAVGSTSSESTAALSPV